MEFEQKTSIHTDSNSIVGHSNVESLILFNFLPIQILDGKPLYKFTHLMSGHQWELGVESRVSDGHWHVLLLRRHGPNIILILDEQIIRNITHSIISQTAVLIEMITLGSAASGDSRDLDLGQ